MYAATAAHKNAVHKISLALLIILHTRVDMCCSKRKAVGPGLNNRSE